MIDNANAEISDKTSFICKQSRILIYSYSNSFAAFSANAAIKIISLSNMLLNADLN